MVPWLYSASEQIFISYDDSESIEAKLDYIRTEDLGGAMVWELSADSDGHDLMEQLHEGMVGDGS
jgi:chitinase